MYNIVVCCVSALSSNVLVNKMKDAAKEQGVKALIWTVGEAGLDLAWAEADIVLLAPQVRHLKAKYENQDRKVPVIAIDEEDFGKMDGAAVLEKTLAILGK